MYMVEFILLPPVYHKLPNLHSPPFLKQLQGVMTSVAGAAGSCGTAGGAVALTADATDVPAASGITLCHATQLVNYSVELNSITADETDRAFDVTYTILATE